MGSMQIGTVDLNKLRGIGDKFVGLARETTGVIMGNDRLQEAGEAQQEKATETLKALRKEAQAQSKESKADALGRKTGQRGRSGVFGEAKGRIKSAAGNAVGNPDLQKEGEDEAAKGAAERQATQARVESKGHEAKAKTADKEEKASR
jgi:uncharacterized protein YjbJ (UPF0337 family)